MLKKFLIAVYNIFKTKTDPCPCGGNIHEKIRWEAEYYTCDKCGQSIDWEEFETRKRLS